MFYELLLGWRLLLNIMSVNISKLKRGNSFENEKIKISFSRSEVSDSLSVYLKDLSGKTTHVLWEISPDRCSQNFDKANEKVRSFVQDKINEWVKDEERIEALRKESIEEKEKREARELNELMDSF